MSFEALDKLFEAYEEEDKKRCERYRNFIKKKYTSKSMEDYDPIEMVSAYINFVGIENLRRSL